MRISDWSSDVCSADLLAQRGPAALTAAVASGQPAFRSLGDQLLTERLDNLGAEQARVAAMRVISARPSRAWEPSVNQVRVRLQLSQDRKSTRLNSSH